MFGSLINKVRTIAVAGAVAAATVVAAAPASAQVGELGGMRGWTVLGVEDIARGDRDRIRIRDGQRYRQLRFCVIGGRARVERMIVRFGNDRREELRVKRQPFTARDCTRAIDLPGRGRGRFLRAVIFEYDARRGNPAIILLGR